MTFLATQTFAVNTTTTAINEGGFPHDVRIYNAGTADVYIDSVRNVSLLGQPIVAGGHVIWPRDVPVYAMSSVVGSIVVSLPGDVSNPKAIGQALADNFDYAGLASQIAVNVSVTGAPPVMRSQTIYAAVVNPGAVWTSPVWDNANYNSAIVTLVINNGQPSARYLWIVSGLSDNGVVTRYASGYLMCGDYEARFPLTCKQMRINLYRSHGSGDPDVIVRVAMSTATVDARTTCNPKWDSSVHGDSRLTNGADFFNSQVGSILQVVPAGQTRILKDFTYFAGPCYVNLGGSGTFTASEIIIGLSRDPYDLSGVGLYGAGRVLTYPLVTSNPTFQTMISLPSAPISVSLRSGEGIDTIMYASLSQGL